MRLLQALVKTVIHIDAHENMGNTLIYNGLLDYKTRTTSPRLFPKPPHPTTKPRPPPHICSQNHQIRKQTRASVINNATLKQRITSVVLFQRTICTSLLIFKEIILRTLKQPLFIRTHA